MTPRSPPTTEENAACPDAHDSPNHRCHPGADRRRHHGFRTVGARVRRRRRRPDADAAVAPAASTLVLYDSTGPYAWLGEVYAIQTANLAGHFGIRHRKKVTQYAAGDVNRYTATIYVGSTYDEPLPTSFLNDVKATTRPVVWVSSNIWKLTAATPDFAARYGWMWSGFDSSVVTGVDYKGTRLTRSTDNNAPIMNYGRSTPRKPRCSRRPCARTAQVPLGDRSRISPMSVRSRTRT